MQAAASWHVEVLVPQPGIELASPAWEGNFLPRQKARETRFFRRRPRKTSRVLLQRISRP